MCPLIILSSPKFLLSVLYNPHVGAPIQTATPLRNPASADFRSSFTNTHTRLVASLNLDWSTSARRPQPTTTARYSLACTRPRNGSWQAPARTTACTVSSRETTQHKLHSDSPQSRVTVWFISLSWDPHARGVDWSTSQMITSEAQ